MSNWLRTWKAASTGARSVIAAGLVARKAVEKGMQVTVTSDEG